MQIVTVTFFRFENFADKWWAFGQMGIRPFKAGQTKDLTFAKMLGTGGGNGFSVRPNFGAYGWLAVWNTEGAAREFFDTNPLFLTTKNRATEHFTVFLRTAVAHGRWDGIEPFQNLQPFDAHLPVAVLTRATIKPSKLRHFWKFVPTVSRSMEGKAGLIFSVGIGELPIIQQATFSLWASAKAMMDYAYNSPQHAEVVKKTRELGWYSEELFARFRVFDTEGSEKFGELEISNLKKMLIV